VPKVPQVQTNFTAGELSPKLLGRVDIGRYNNGAAELENVIPMVQGGVRRRDGSRYIAAAKNANKRARLIPFVYSRSQAFMLEVGDQYIRFFKADRTRVETSPGVAYEIASPYTEAVLSEIDYTRGADTMFFWQELVYPRRLRRFADTNWVLDTCPFDPAPFDEIGFRPAATLALSATTVGTGRTATAGAATFLASDVGRHIWAGSGVAEITAYTDTTHVTVSITSAFDSASYAADAWEVRESPQTTCTPSAVGTVGATIQLTLSAAGWRSDDVGKWVRINDGLVQITAYTSTTVVDAKVLIVLTTAVGAIANAWTLNAAVWNSHDGYPCTGTLFEQRLIAAGSPGYPRTVWGSETGIPFSFLLGTADDEAFSYTVDADEADQIRYISAMEALVVLTYGGEFTLTGGVEKPLTPTNVKAKPRSNNGCAQVRPCRVRNEELFVQRAGKKVRAASFNEETGIWAAPDMSVLAEHIAAEGITELTWKQEPDGLVYGTREDGALASVTFDRDQDNTVAWARQTMDGGVIESVATIPTDDGEDTWMLVRRTINGSTVRYIEVFDSTLYTDCAKTATSVPGATTWTGFDHLNGELCDVMADGVPMPQVTVTGGSFTLPRKAYSVECGKRFAPRIKLLPPDVGQGQSQGSAMSLSALYLRFLSTVGCYVNGSPIPFRQLGDGVLDSPIEPFSGIKAASPPLGWEINDAPIEITQVEPGPFTLLSVVRELTFNQG